MWTPRKGSTLTMYVEDKKGNAVWDTSKNAKSVRAVLSDFGIKTENCFPLRVKLPARKLKAASDELDRRLASIGCFARGFIHEGHAEANDRSWYRIRSHGAEPDMAIRMRKDIHIGYVRMEDYDLHYAHVVSQQFVDTVRVYRLKGLEFLPVPPENRKRQDGWWEAFATHPLGRGIDHSVMDSARVDKFCHSVNQCEELRRMGISKHSRSGMNESKVETDLVDPSRIGDAWIASLMASGRFVLKSSTRYIQEELPKAVDFAFTRLSLEKSPSELLYRDIVCSHKAKEILVAAGMLRPTHLEVIEVIPAAEADQPILDRTVKPPLPRAMLRPEDVEKERARRQALIDALPVPVVKRPGRRLTLPQAAERLRSLWEKPWGRWGESGPVGTKTAEAKKIAKSAKVPKVWKEIAPLLPLIVEDPEAVDMDLWRADKPEVSGWVLEDAEQSDDAESPTKKDIEIGSTIFGDWYSIRLTDKEMPKDAKIRLWDHETGSIKQEWDNVAAFVQYLIETMEAVVKVPLARKKRGRV